MLVAPFVFFLDGDPSFDLSDEVDSLVWSPLAPMHGGRSRAREDRLIAGVPTPFNGYRVRGGHFVWGLTYRMIETLFRSARSGVQSARLEPQNPSPCRVRRVLPPPKPPSTPSISPLMRQVRKSAGATKSSPLRVRRVLPPPKPTQPIQETRS